MLNADVYNLSALFTKRFNIPQASFFLQKRGLEFSPGKLPV